MIYIQDYYIHLYMSYIDVFVFYIKVCLEYYEHEFVELACQCPCVVVCRCSPTQKADIVKLLKVHSGRRTCAIGNYVKLKVYRYKLLQVLPKLLSRVFTRNKISSKQ